LLLCGFYDGSRCRECGFYNRPPYRALYSQRGVVARVAIRVPRPWSPPGSRRTLPPPRRDDPCSPHSPATTPLQGDRGTPPRLTAGINRPESGQERQDHVGHLVGYRGTKSGSTRSAKRGCGPGARSATLRAAAVERRHAGICTAERDIGGDPPGSRTRCSSRLCRPRHDRREVGRTAPA
jgi:hypothetical protein